MSKVTLKSYILFCEDLFSRHGIYSLNGIDIEFSFSFSFFKQNGYRTCHLDTPTTWDLILSSEWIWNFIWAKTHTSISTKLLVICAYMHHCALTIFWLMKRGRESDVSSFSKLQPLVWLMIWGLIEEWWMIRVDLVWERDAEKQNHHFWVYVVREKC